MNSKNIIIGAVVGGAVASIAAALLCKQNNRSGFRDTCEDYGDKIKSMVSDFSNVDVSNIIETIKDEISDFPDIDNKDFLKGVVVGAALGGLLGSTGSKMLCKGQNGNRFKSATQDIFDLAQAGLKCWNKLSK